MGVRQIEGREERGGERREEKEEREGEVKSC